MRRWATPAILPRWERFQFRRVLPPCHVRSRLAVEFTVSGEENVLGDSPEVSKRSPEFGAISRSSVSRVLNGHPASGRPFERARPARSFR